MKSSYVYARQGEVEYGERNGAGFQQDECVKYHGRFPHLPPLHDEPFIDYCGMGKRDTYKERPAARAMRFQMSAGDVVIVHNMDRFARRLNDVTFIINKIVQIGVQVHVVDLHGEPMNFSSYAGQVLLMAWALGDRFEAGVSSILSKPKFDHVNELPYGATLKDGKVVRCPTHWKRLRKMRDLHQSGKSVGEVAKFLNGKGWKTLHGRRFSDNGVRALLSQTNDLAAARIPWYYD